ncbi:MAG: hypothetical protein ACI4PC_05510, partial [Oscillospiraceae bacterium]
RRAAAFSKKWQSHFFDTLDPAAPMAQPGFNLIGEGLFFGTALFLFCCFFPQAVLQFWQIPH